MKQNITRCILFSFFLCLSLVSCSTKNHKDILESAIDGVVVARHSPTLMDFQLRASEMNT